MHQINNSTPGLGFSAWQYYVLRLETRQIKRNDGGTVNTPENK
jgi:hypothetical protein